MLAISRAEFVATGRRSTRWFHGLLAGNIGQLEARGSGRAAPRLGTSAIEAHVSRNSSRRIRRRSYGSPRTRGRGRGQMSGDDEDAPWRHVELRLVHLAD